MIPADVKLDTLGYFCPMPIISDLEENQRTRPRPSPRGLLR